MKDSAPRKFRDKWRVSWSDADGHRQFAVFDKKGDAQRELDARKAEAERIRAGVQARAPEPRTFDELADYWIEHRAPAKRSGRDDVSIINSRLRPFFGGMRLAAISVAVVDQFKARARQEGALATAPGGKAGKKPLSDKSIHNYLTMLIAMLNLAVELGWLAVVPRLRKPRLVEQEYTWLRSDDDIRQLLATAARHGHGVMELYATAVYTGLRAGELLGLRWSEVDLERRLVTVLRSHDRETTKGGEIRHVPIVDPLLPLLRGWRLRCGSPEWVFPSSRGTRQQESARVTQEVLKAVQREMGRPEADWITFHDLRHTFASHYMMRGGDLFRLQKLLGHKSVAMTQRYAHLAPEVFKEDYGRFADLLPRAEGVVLAMGTPRRQEMSGKPGDGG